MAWIGVDFDGTLARYEGWDERPAPLKLGAHHPSGPDAALISTWVLDRLGRTRR